MGSKDKNPSNDHPVIKPDVQGWPTGEPRAADEVSPHSGRPGKKIPTSGNGEETVSGGRERFAKGGDARKQGVGRGAMPAKPGRSAPTYDDANDAVTKAGKPKSNDAKKGGTRGQTR